MGVSVSSTREGASDVLRDLQLPLSSVTAIIQASHRYHTSVLTDRLGLLQLLSSEDKKNHSLQVDRLIAIFDIDGL